MLIKFIIVSLSVGAATTAFGTPLPGSLHTFHMNSDEVRNGYVIGNRDDWVRVQVSDPQNASTAEPVVTVLLKQQSICKVIPLEWHLWDSIMKPENEEPQDQEMLEQKKETLAQAWNAMNCILGIPEARVGTLGNVLAQTLVTIWRQTVDGRRIQMPAIAVDAGLLCAAQDLYATVEEKSHCPQERNTARAGRLAIKRFQKQNHKAAAEAKAWIEESPHPPPEAWDALGESLLTEAEELIQEHPRWKQDRFVQPKIISLFNTCLNASLISFVRHPVELHWAARGLIRSARVYELWEKPQLSTQTAADLIRFYPQFQNQLSRILQNLTDLEKQIQ